MPWSLLIFPHDSLKMRRAIHSLREVKFLEGKVWLPSRVTRNTNLQEKNNKRVFPPWCFLFL